MDFSTVSDPQTRAYLERLAAEPAPPPATIAEARQAMLDSALERSGPPEPVAAVRDVVLDGSGGPLPARVYAPTSEPAPGVCLYLHGGGFVVGSVEVYDAPCRRLANRSGWVVVSVDYRLAPEHPFPAAVEDADAALRWVAEQRAELGAPDGRLAVAGDSAGGALAAVAARHARDAGLGVDLQVLVYPVTDAACDSPSYGHYGRGYDLDAEDMRRDWERYLAGADPAHPDASPLRATDLAGLAPALVVLAELDPLHDEGLAYAGRLRDAGVDVAVRDYAGQIHGFFRASALFDRADDALDDVAAALRGVAAR